MAMIPKRHGPDRKIAVIPLGRCEICKGEGVIKGVFHDIPCAACHGAGLVHRETGEALPPEEMVKQLRLRLNRANRLLKQYDEKNYEKGGPGADYGKRSGAWVGD